MAEADFELEAKRKEDSSWHPCQVFFSSDSSAASGLTVDFGSQFEEDVIYSEEEALARLRFRSSPLQGDDCSHIKEGDHVLASLKTQSKSLFFDCEVEKVSRRHTKKIYCRCTFQIKRLCTDSQDGSVSITSNAIMKISTTKISHHPAVAAFLTSFITVTCSNVSSLATGPVSETGIHIMLEKQIEDIFRSVRAPREGFIEAKECLPRAFLEKSNRAYLSPLGARAALASLMQEQPRNSEVSICNASQNTAKNKEHTRPAVLAVTRALDFDVRINEKVSIDSTPSREGTSNKKRAAKKATQTERSANLLVTEKKPIQTLAEPKDEKLNIVCSGIHSKSSAAGKNVNRPMGTTRSSRSAVQKEIQNSSNHVELNTPTEDTHQMLDERPEDKKSDTACSEKRLRKSAAGKDVNRPMEATRSTRSTVQKEIKKSNNHAELNTPSADTDQTLEKRLEDKKSDTACVEKRLRKSASGKNVNRHMETTRSTRSTIQKEIKHAELNTPTEDIDQTVNERVDGKKSDTASVEKRLRKSASERNVNRPMGTTRSTRSTIQKETKNSDNHAELNTPMEDTNQALDEQPDDKKSDTPCVEKRFRKSAAGKNVICPMEATSLTRSAVQKEIRNLNNDVELNTPTEDTPPPLSHTRRLTRSVSQNGGSLKSNMESEESKQAEGASLDPKKRDQVSTLNKQTNAKRPLRSPVEPDVQSSQSRESNKKQRLTDIFPNIARKGEVSDSKGCLEPDLRFSPRLKFLSPTRSQKKTSGC